MAIVPETVTVSVDPTTDALSQFTRFDVLI
jgi:hypothetical protein